MEFLEKEWREYSACCCILLSPFQIISHFKLLNFFQIISYFHFPRHNTSPFYLSPSILFLSFSFSEHFTFFIFLSSRAQLQNDL